MRRNRAFPVCYGSLGRGSTGLGWIAAFLAALLAASMVVGCGGSRRRPCRRPGRDAGRPDAAVAQGVSFDSKIGEVIRLARSVRAVTLEGDGLTLADTILIRGADRELVPSTIETRTVETYPGAQIEYLGVGEDPERGLVYLVGIAQVDGRQCEVLYLEDSLPVLERCRERENSVSPSAERAIEELVPRSAIRGVERVRNEDREELWVEVFDGEKAHLVVLDTSDRVSRHVLWIPARLGVRLDE